VSIFLQEYLILYAHFVYILCLCMIGSGELMLFYSATSMFIASVDQLPILLECLLVYTY
jgi:hypothetical protein